MGLEQASERHQWQYNAKLTIWNFIDPPDAMLWLFDRGKGWIDQDQNRRRRKAAILKIGGQR